MWRGCRRARPGTGSARRCPSRPRGRRRRPACRSGVDATVTTARGGVVDVSTPSPRTPPSLSGDRGRDQPPQSKRRRKRGRGKKTSRVRTRASASVGWSPLLSSTRSAAICTVNSEASKASVARPPDDRGAIMRVGKLKGRFRVSQRRIASTCNSDTKATSYGVSNIDLSSPSASALTTATPTTSSPHN